MQLVREAAQLAPRRPQLLQLGDEFGPLRQHLSERLQRSTDVGGAERADRGG